MRGKWTEGPWKRIAQGGSSTVVAAVKPTRNDTRIPPYGYSEADGHCIAYPFIEDDGGVRRDFVCFSHEDAYLIAAAPALADYVAKRASEGDAEALALMETVHGRRALARPCQPPFRG